MSMTLSIDVNDFINELQVLIDNIADELSIIFKLSIILFINDQILLLSNKFITSKVDHFLI